MAASAGAAGAGVLGWLLALGAITPLSVTATASSSQARIVAPTADERPPRWTLLSRGAKQTPSVGVAQRLPAVNQPWAPSPAPSPGPASNLNMPAAPIIADASKFHAATDCSHCIWEVDVETCACEPALAFLACVTEYCQEGTSNESFFSERCVELQNYCGSDLQIDCHGADSHCGGRFHQEPDGVIGIKDFQPDGEKAFCGPRGKCMGSLKMKVSVHKPAYGALLECSLAKKTGACRTTGEEWVSCTTEVESDEVSCEIPMDDVKLQADEEVDAYCVLNRIQDGERLCHPVWTTVSNNHKGIEMGTNTSEIAQMDSSEIDAELAAGRGRIAAMDEELRKAAETRRQRDARRLSVENPNKPEASLLAEHSTPTSLRH